MRSFPTVDNELNLNHKMFSCSSSVIFELLSSGKCVYKLPMINGGINHYNIDQYLLNSSTQESLNLLKNQQMKILEVH